MQFKFVAGAALVIIGLSITLIACPNPSTASPTPTPTSFTQGTGYIKLTVNGTVKNFVYYVGGVSTTTSSSTLLSVPVTNYTAIGFAQSNGSGEWASVSAADNGSTKSLTVIYYTATADYGTYITTDSTKMSPFTLPTSSGQTLSVIFTGASLTPISTGGSFSNTTAITRIEVSAPRP